MRIGELARRTGVPTKTIRYYESIGVLPEPDREANDYRNFPEETVDRLAFIRDAQATGLTLTEISSVLDLRSQGEATCHHVIDLLDRHLAALDQHIRSLGATREKLAKLTQQARSLDPTQCRNPNRCQTITQGTNVNSDRGLRHLHTAPSGHHH
ncbi:MAG: heavy metal-responsive transcriptional regulator [Acidimicrobiia bacterium]